MKLLRFGQPGHEKPGVLHKDRRIDLSSRFKDWDTQFFDHSGMEELASLDLSVFPEVPETMRWASPIARPGKVICIGLNYSDHAAESGMELPKEPIVFQKGANTIIGPYDEVQIPRNSVKTDWEVELAIIIAKNARYLDKMEQAAEYIAGYAVSNDISEREFQLERGGQWTKGKSCDTFNPLGPYLVTPDEIPDVRTLPMHLDLNGKRMQTGNTAKMVFDPFYLVHYLSQFMTLEAGDVINTGTPPGVGLGMKPPLYLQAGDCMELSVEGLGTQKQTCVPFQKLEKA